MRQLTLDIEDGLLAAAEDHAQRSGRTLSEVVGELLGRALGWPPPAEPPLPESVLPILQRYSAGTLSRRDAMAALGLPPERQPDFVDAMNRLAVPWPQPDRAQVDREAEIVVQAIREARGEG